MEQQKLAAAAAQQVVVSSQHPYHALHQVLPDVASQQQPGGHIGNVSEFELARRLGVRFDSSNAAWVARWTDTQHDRKKSRWFSVAKYGNSAARRLAIQASLSNLKPSDYPSIRDLQEVLATFATSAASPAAAAAQAQGYLGELPQHAAAAAAAMFADTAAAAAAAGDTLSPIAAASGKLLGQYAAAAAAGAHHHHLAAAAALQQQQQSPQAAAAAAAAAAAQAHPFVMGLNHQVHHPHHAGLQGYMTAAQQMYGAAAQQSQQQQQQQQQQSQQSESNEQSSSSAAVTAAESAAAIGPSGEDTGVSNSQSASSAEGDTIDGDVGSAGDTHGSLVVGHGGDATAAQADSSVAAAAHVDAAFLQSLAPNNRGAHLLPTSLTGGVDNATGARFGLSGSSSHEDEDEEEDDEDEDDDDDDSADGLDGSGVGSDEDDDEDGGGGGSRRRKKRRLDAAGTSVATGGATDAQQLVAAAQQMQQYDEQQALLYGQQAQNGASGGQQQSQAQQAAQAHAQQAQHQHAALQTMAAAAAAGHVHPSYYSLYQNFQGQHAQQSQQAHAQQAHAQQAHAQQAQQAQAQAQQQMLLHHHHQQQLHQAQAGAQGQQQGGNAGALAAALPFLPQQFVLPMLHPHLQVHHAAAAAAAGFLPHHHGHHMQGVDLPGGSASTSAKMTCERGLHYSKCYRGSQECWIAVWNTKGGRIMHEAFDVTDLGYEGAKAKAREARDAAHSNNVAVTENSRPSWKSHSNTGIPHVSLDSQQLRFRAHKFGRRLCRSFSFGRRRGSYASRESAFDAAVLWLIQTPTEEEIAAVSGCASNSA